MKLSFDKKYFSKYERESNRAHEPMPATYQVFSIGCQKYFQLDCYNKNTDIKEIGPSVQSNHKLQFDKETAARFIELLKKEFGFQ